MAAALPGIRLNLDPRAKLLLTGTAGLACLLSPGFAALAVVDVLLAGWLAAAAALRDYLRWLKLTLPMCFFFGAVSVWAFGPGAGALAGLKLLTFMTVGFIFFASTLPEDLANALVKSGLPYSIAFVVSAGMQFVPVLGARARAVMEAQQARGLPVGLGWRALKYYPAFLLPLLVQSFQIAEELAEAMETRGFGRAGRSFYRDFRFCSRDWVALAGAAACAALWLWGFVL